MYISQDRTNLEMCKSVFGDDFEFDPDGGGSGFGRRDRRRVPPAEALMQALVLSGREVERT